MTSLFRRLLFTLALLLPISSTAQAQQPFYTDDADVTPRGHFHFEFSNEFDLLQRSSLPTVKQNTADFELDYGLFEGVEIGIESPLLTHSLTLPEPRQGVHRASVIQTFHLSTIFIRSASTRDYPRWQSVSISSCQQAIRNDNWDPVCQTST